MSTYQTPQSFQNLSIHHKTVEWKWNFRPDAKGFKGLYRKARDSPWCCGDGDGNEEEDLITHSSWKLFSNAQDLRLESASKQGADPEPGALTSPCDGWMCWDALLEKSRIFSAFLQHVSNLCFWFQQELLWNRLHYSGRDSIGIAHF